jgi:hypothetical protein
VYREKLNFEVRRTAGVKFLQLINKSPRTGEQAVYQSRLGPSTSKAYGHIAFLPESGNGGRVLIVEGTGSAGTETAADFLLADVNFRNFLQRIRRPDGSVPGFELLVETDAILEGKAPEGRWLAERIYS